MSPLQQHLDQYNATLAPNVHFSETARAGLNLLREAAGLVAAAGEDTTTPRQRALANKIIAAIGERPAQ